MLKYNIFKSIEDIQESIGNSSECKIYSECNQNVNNSWDQIYLIDKIRLKSSANLKKNFKQNNSLILLVLMRLNAKFRFRIVRKFFENIHLLIEVSRLNIEIKTSSKTKIIEDKIFDEDNSLVFYPSLKKSLKNIALLDLLKKSRKKTGAKHNKRLLFHESLNNSCDIEMFFVKSCIKKLESTILNSKINEIYIGGTMNLFNRIIALIFLKNNLTVVYKDHGFVRDCCAQFGIFTKAIPFSKNAIKSSIEKHIKHV